MAVLDDLFKFKEKVDIINPKTGKVRTSVWVKIVGDEDLKESFRYARIASSSKRAQYNDKESAVYKDEIADLGSQPREDWESLILASKENEFSNSAPIVTVREDLPEIEEIAIQPDAPTLEELERLDRAEKEQADKYKAAIEDYVQTKLNEVKANLKELTDEKVLELTIVEYINVQALQAFLEELNQQRVYRGTYTDEACTKKAFSNFEAFKNAAGTLKQQLIDAYNRIELSTDDVKN